MTHIAFSERNRTPVHRRHTAERHNHMRAVQNRGHAKNSQGRLIGLNCAISSAFPIELPENTIFFSQMLFFQTARQVGWTEKEERG